MRRRLFLAGGLAAAASCRRRRGAGFPGYAFVANEEGQAVAVVDLTAFAVARHVRLAGNPTEVIAHASRPAVYVLTAATGAVYEIDSTRLSLARRAAPCSSAVSMRLSGESLWVLSREPRQLVRLASGEFRVRTRIALPATPSDFDLSRDGSLAAVSFREQGMLAVADLRAGKLLWKGAPGGGATGLIRFQSDGRNVLAARTQDRLLSIVQAATGRVVTHLPLAIRPEHFCFKSDGGQLFITGEGMDAVVVVYPYQTQVAETMLAGRAPGAMAVSSSPDFLFVANPTAGNVTIVNIETHRVIAVAPSGVDPGFITVTPDNQYALVLNRGSGDMAVIRITTITAKRTKSAALFTMIPVGSKPVSAAVQAV